MRRPQFIAFLASITSALVGCVNGKRSATSASSPSPMSGMMGSMMNGSSGGMMNVSQRDMSVYMEMFNFHRESTFPVCTDTSNKARKSAA